MTDDDIELIPGLVSIWEFDNNDDELLSHSLVLKDNDDVHDQSSESQGAAGGGDFEEKDHPRDDDGKFGDGDGGAKSTKEQTDTAKTDTYTDKEKETLDLSNRMFAVMTTNKEYDQYSGMIDTLRDKVSPELIAELETHLDEKFTKDDFKDWKKSDKKQKFTVSGFVNKTNAEVAKNAWNDLPDDDRKLLKGFNIKTSKARSLYAVGSFNTKTDNMTLRLHVTDSPFNSQKNYFENIAHHEAGHARWHNKYTPEQKEQWKKKVDEEGLGNVTSYSNSYFKTVDTYERAVKQLERRRDSFTKRGYPNIARDAQNDIDQFEKAIPHARELAYNETHSEVYGYMNRPTEGGKTSFKFVDKDKVKKGGEILNEVFGK